MGYSLLFWYLVFLPTGSATVTGKGPKTETWQRKIGLKNGWEGTERFSQLRVDVDEYGVGGDLGLSGDYTLHHKCGTAQASLHSCEANGLHLFLGRNLIAKKIT